jgi:hypothetical protein
MVLSASPKRVQLIARELALLRALAADRRQASWLALLRAREEDGRRKLTKMDEGDRGERLE